MLSLDFVGDELLSDRTVIDSFLQHRDKIAFLLRIEMRLIPTHRRYPRRQPTLLHAFYQVARVKAGPILIGSYLIEIKVHRKPGLPGLRQPLAYVYHLGAFVERVDVIPFVFQDTYGVWVLTDQRKPVPHV